MKKIILYEHGSSSNHGCEAIVRSTCDILGLNRSNSILFTNDIITDKEYGLDQIINLSASTAFSFSDNIKRVIRKATGGRIYSEIYGSQKYVDKRWGAAISIGGDNYCYKGLIPDLIRRHQTLHNTGNKVILWGASFKEQLFSDELIEDLKSYDLITVRESLSAKYLSDAGINNYIITFDSAFALKSIETDWPDKKEHNSIVGINLSPLIFCYADKKQILQCYFRLINYILNNTDFDIALIPHVTTSGTDDRKLLADIKTQYHDCERVFAVIGNYNCCELKSLISKCRFFVGARTHATIAAYSTMVPTCVLGYSSKALGLAQDLFGTSVNYVVDSITLEDENTLVKSFDFLLQNELDIKNTLKEVVPLKLKLLENASAQVKELIYQ